MCTLHVRHIQQAVRLHFDLLLQLCVIAIDMLWLPLCAALIGGALGCAQKQRRQQDDDNVDLHDLSLSIEVSITLVYLLL